MMNKGFNTTNIRKEISELKVANEMIRLAINSYRKDKAEKEQLKAEIKKLQKRRVLLQGLIRLRLESCSC